VAATRYIREGDAARYLCLMTALWVSNPATHAHFLR
jgi:hypothetical protein